MADKSEYDFTDFKSAPSSVKLTVEAINGWIAGPKLPIIPVNAGATIRVEFYAKSKDNQKGTTQFTRFGLSYFTSTVKGDLLNGYITIPDGTHPWSKFTQEYTTPAGTYQIVPFFGATKGTVWFDDLKIYQNNVLIYSNDFSNWNPYIGAGIGAIAGIPAYIITKKSKPKNRAIITVGATIAGIAIGGAVGYLTAKP